MTVDPYLVIRQAHDVLQRMWSVEVGVPDSIRPRAAEIAQALNACQGALVDRLTQGDK